MRILFVHSNYPAQFRHLSDHYARDPQHQVVFLSQGKEWTAPSDGEIQLRRYQLGRDPQGQLCHPYLKRFESAVLMGQACLREAMQLRQEGFEPDLIVGHSGFGSTLYLKEIWPKARFLGYFEWFYRTSGSDVGFGEKDPVSPDTACRVHTYNAPIVMDLALSDQALCPTQWQAQQFPKPLQRQLEVVFDGINTEMFSPLPETEKQKGLQIGKLKIPGDVPLVTYTTRGFEPYRGWPQVAEGLSLLLKRNAQVHVLLVGSDEVAYGAARGWPQLAPVGLRYLRIRLQPNALVGATSIQRLPKGVAAQLGTCVLDYSFHSQLGLDGIFEHRLRRGGKRHPTSAGGD